ncbi:MAG TPA: hypothetical protein VJH96_02985 [Patescibacteria group bacterium]|nr:hypothetical protein [Patescibacteria group bacterium]
MNNKYLLESLAMDLKRVAMGLHHGSYVMAERFIKEALKRKGEIESSTLPPYILNILGKLHAHIDKETALMYSTLIQNYTQSSHLTNEFKKYKVYDTV